MASPAGMRYSDKRLRGDFTVYVLCDQPISFTMDEIETAFAQDYPSLGWERFLDPEGAFTIGDASFAAGLGPHRITLASFVGQCDLEWERYYAKNGMFAGARAAVEAHQTYLSVTVKSTGTDLKARFEAARLMTCLSAVFAALPACRCIYFPSADAIIPPDRWLKAAQTAVVDEFPLLEWMNPTVNTLDKPADGPALITATSIGVAAFLGVEIAVPKTRTAIPEALAHLSGAAYLLLQCGHKFKDSNTLGVEGSDVKNRLRFMAESDDAQTDLWCILDQNCEVDEMAVFGERTGIPPPPGFDNQQFGKPGFLKRLMRGGATH